MAFQNPKLATCDSEFLKKEVGGLIKTHRLRSSTAALFALLLLARAEKRASCVHSGPSAIVGKRSLVNVWSSIWHLQALRKECILCIRIIKGLAMDLKH